jgi:acyl-CoA synthetase (NDP forming)/GNAT superfamily N-acetyltransferase
VPTDSATHRAEVLLADGTVAVIRPLTRFDHAELLALHLRASDRSRWLRFFSAGTATAEAYVEHLGASPTTTALGVEVSGTLVAVGTAEPVGDDAEEVAFLVADEWHGRGIASHLLEQLAADARVRGVSRLTADVLVENHQMLNVFLDVGFTTTRSSRNGVTTVTLDPNATGTFVAAATSREALSEHSSLAPLLSPRSAALVGVRRDGTGVGGAVLASIRAAGYTGSLVAVHPSAESVADLPTFRRIGDIPQPPDLVIVAAPGEAALSAVTDAATAGVRAAVVLSSGFHETGRHGADLQRRMLEVARQHSMRLVGPNCLGVVLNDPGIRLNATFQRFLPPPGGVAFAAQSGGVGIVLLDTAQRRDLGVRCFLSLGNKADVSGNDLLSAWRDDPEVTVAGLYLESFGNARKFARIARSFGERKPLLAVVGGRSAGGARAGASHTAGALTGAVSVQALFTQAGVVECQGADELVETAAVFAEQPHSPGGRLGILSNAGGMGVLAADAADRAGLLVPTLAHASRHRLEGLVSGTVGTSNPVDVGAGASPDQLAGAAEVLLAAEEVDAVLLVLVGTEVTDAEHSLREVAQVRRQHPDKPVVVVPLGGVTVAADLRGSGEAPRMTTLPSVESAVRSLAHVARYEQWRRAPRAAPPPGSAARVRAVHERARWLLATRGEGFVELEDARSLVQPFGVSPLGNVVHGVSAALDEAARVGYPVAVKPALPDLVHRTERGLVRVGLTSPARTAESVRWIAAGVRLPEEAVPIWVQPVRHGVELALGIARDEMLGSLVMVAAGGVNTDVLADRTFLMPPIDGSDAEHALRSLRCFPLLLGHRGSPPVDLDAVRDLVTALGQLAVEVPEVAELDLNPVLAHDRGLDVIDLKLRLAAPPAEQHDGNLRELRPRG